MVNTAVMQLTQGAQDMLPVGGATQQSAGSDGPIFGDLLGISLVDTGGRQGGEPADPDSPPGDVQSRQARPGLAHVDASELAGAMIAQLVAPTTPSEAQIVTSGAPPQVDAASGVATLAARPGPAGPVAEPVGLLDVALPGAVAPPVAPDADPAAAQPAQVVGQGNTPAVASDAPIAGGLVSGPAVTAEGATPVPMAPGNSLEAAAALSYEPVATVAPSPEPAADPEPVQSTESPASPARTAGPQASADAGSAPDTGSASNAGSAPRSKPAGETKSASTAEPSQGPRSYGDVEVQPDAEAGDVAGQKRPRAPEEARPAKEAFLLAPRPAQDGGQPKQTSGVARQFQDAVADSVELVQAPQGPAQTQDQPAEAKGPRAETDDLPDAAPILTQAGSFDRAVAEASAPGTAQPAGPDAELHQRVIDQVVRAVSLHRSQDRTDMVVKLHPPELGTLSVRVTHDAQGTTSQIEATSESVRSLLQAHLPLLVDALSDAGVRLNSVTVTSNTSFGALMHNSAQESGQQQYGAPGHTFAQAQGGTGAADEAPVPDFIDTAGAAASLVQSAGYSWLA